MSRLLRAILVVAFALAGLQGAAPAYAQTGEECRYVCSDHCDREKARWQSIITQNDDLCGGGGPVTCVPNCTARYLDGSCRQYGRDFCGRQPVCVQKCGARYLDGSCRSWQADHCGEAPQRCVARCTARYLDGNCRDWGEDFCGRNASCQAQCLARYPDGTCRDWGADQCRS